MDLIMSSCIPTEKGHRSKPIVVNKHSAPYAIFLSNMGLNRAFILNFQSVNVRNYSSFLRNPMKFVTLSDMCVVHSTTGVSIDRQVHILLYGFLDKELTAKGRRVIGSAKEILDIE